MNRSAQLPRDFLADDQAAHRGRNDGGGAERLDFVGQRRAEFFDHGHLLERERALKELAAVQAAAQDEMAFQQRAGVTEDLQDFVFRHRTNVKSKVRSSKSKVT